MHARAARGTGIRRTAPLSDFQPLCCVCPRSTKGILFIGCPLFIHAAEGRTAYMTCEGAGAPGGSDLGSPWRLRWQPGGMPRRLRCLLPRWLLGWTPRRMTRWLHAWLPGWLPLRLPGRLSCRVPRWLPGRLPPWLPCWLPGGVPRWLPRRLPRWLPCWLLGGVPRWLPRRLPRLLPRWLSCGLPVRCLAGWGGGVGVSGCGHCQRVSARSTPSVPRYSGRDLKAWDSPDPPPRQCWHGQWALLWCRPATMLSNARIGRRGAHRQRPLEPPSSMLLRYTVLRGAAQLQY